MALADQLRQLFADFLQAEFIPEVLPNGHVAGSLITPRFADEAFDDRRRLMRETLDRALSEGRLTREDMPRVSTILLYSPAEWNELPAET